MQILASENEVMPYLIENPKALEKDRKILTAKRMNEWKLYNSVFKISLKVPSNTFQHWKYHMQTKVTYSVSTKNRMSLRANNTYILEVRS